MREITYREAVREAMREEMHRDANVFQLGEDIGVFGGSYKVTLGLVDEFGPERILDTPLSEAAIAGAATWNWWTWSTASSRCGCKGPARAAP
jgi:pyruvate dehydrogenase E1 component beta subunit